VVFLCATLGFGVITALAWILFRIDRANHEAANRANEGIGWSAVEEENARRMAKWRAEQSKDEDQ
ncbi:MAG: hypothetical protein AAF503_11325, partial [Pseudomonadota bacterium]